MFVYYFCIVYNSTKEQYFCQICFRLKLKNKICGQTSTLYMDSFCFCSSQQGHFTKLVSTAEVIAPTGKKCFISKYITVLTMKHIQRTRFKTSQCHIRL